MKYLIGTSTDPYWNLAREEFMLKQKRDEDYLLLWQNENSLILGRHQSAQAELNLEAAKQYGTHIVRRITGGGAVYHDLGNLNFTFVTDQDKKNSFLDFLMPMLGFLKSTGAEVSFNDRNDMELYDHEREAFLKISGNAQALDRNRILHHGTLLICSDLERMSQLLTPHPEKLSRHQVASVQSRVGNLARLMGKDLSPLEMAEDFVLYLSEKEQIPMEAFELTDAEEAEIMELVTGKYRTEQWNFEY